MSKDSTGVPQRAMEAMDSAIARRSNVSPRTAARAAASVRVQWRARSAAAAARAVVTPSGTTVPSRRVLGHALQERASMTAKRGDRGTHHGERAPAAVAASVAARTAAEVGRVDGSGAAHELARAAWRLQDSVVALGFRGRGRPNATPRTSAASSDGVKRTAGASSVAMTPTDLVRGSKLVPRPRRAPRFGRFEKALRWPGRELCHRAGQASDATVVRKRAVVPMLRIPSKPQSGRRSTAVHLGVARATSARRATDDRQLSARQRALEDAREVWTARAAGEGEHSDAPLLSIVSASRTTSAPTSSARRSPAPRFLQEARRRQWKSRGGVRPKRAPLNAFAAARKPSSHGSHAEATLHSVSESSLPANDGALWGAAAPDLSTAAKERRLHPAVPFLCGTGLKMPGDPAPPSPKCGEAVGASGTHVCAGAASQQSNGATESSEDDGVRHSRPPAEACIGAGGVEPVTWFVWPTTNKGRRLTSVRNSQHVP